MINFMEKLTRLRCDRRWTLQKTADLIGVSYSTYNNYENKGCQPTFAVMRELARVFGVTVDYLVGVDAAQYDLLTQAGFQISYEADGSLFVYDTTKGIRSRRLTPTQAQLICDSVRAIQHRTIEAAAEKMIESMRFLS